MTRIHELTGSVTVNYITTEGRVIKSPVQDKKNLESKKIYSTVDKKLATITTEDGKTYKLVPSLTNGDENGTITLGEDKQITYIYEEVTGDVVVNYIDTDGNTIKVSVTDTPLTSTGTDYDTRDNKPAIIITEDGSVYEVISVFTKGRETGKVTAGTTQVTYVYRQLSSPAPIVQKGRVVVEYYNTSDEKIAEDFDAISEMVTGTEYATVDYRPTIITKNGLKHFFKGLKDTSATEKGKVVEGTTKVQYVYEPAGSVTVNYVTTDGMILKGSVTVEENAEPGKNYSTQAQKKTTIITEDGKTYHLVPRFIRGEENGRIASGEDKQITYVYQEVTGDVVVNYIDIEEKIIKSPVTALSLASTGTEYDTTDRKPLKISTEDGSVYEILPILTKGEETGRVVAGTIQVTYVYRKISSPNLVVRTGEVVVEYYNTADEKIAEDIVCVPEGEIGAVYETLDYKPSIITKAGVTYFYKELKETSAAEKGIVAEGITTVQYVFEPAGSVTVSYVLSDGAEDPIDMRIEENARPGKAYSTENLKLEVVTTQEGKTYRLVPSLTTGEENGRVVSGKDKQVTYVYEEITGTVVVNYIDTEGNVIKNSVTDTPVTSTGTDYDTTDNKPTTITAENGSVYELIPVLTKGDEIGKVAAGLTQVTYVYRKLATPVPEVKKGPVVIRYVELGNEANVLKEPVLDEYMIRLGSKFEPFDLGSKLTDIVKDNLCYVLVPSETTAIDSAGNSVAEVGEFIEGTIVVTYKYQVATAGILKNSVTLDESVSDTLVSQAQSDYVDASGAMDDSIIIPGQVPDERAVSAGEVYDTSDNISHTITTEDGTTYELVGVDGSETGIIVDGKTTEATYVYRKVETLSKKIFTNYVDENGISIAPQEDGSAPFQSISGYDFVKTVTDSEGDTTHIYGEVTQVVTNHVDENGISIAPQEDGSAPFQSISGYDFVKTVTDSDGNTTHIYHKVETPVTSVQLEAPTPDKPEQPMNPVHPDGISPPRNDTIQLPDTDEAPSTAGVIGATTLLGTFALTAKHRVKKRD
ncbi:TPA: MucBP domain-containing protein [Streptococcus suis]